MAGGKKRITGEMKHRSRVEGRGEETDNEENK